MKKDKSEIVVDILYYVFITLVLGAVLTAIIVALVKEFVR